MMGNSELYYKSIEETANGLIREFSTSDPFVIAGCLGIHLMYSPFEKLKGVYKAIGESSFIILNQNNGEEMNRIVCAHELGHHLLHRSFAKDNAICESTIFDMSRKYELEANIFASHLLLEDSLLVEWIKEGYDLEKIAKLTKTDPNLVALKCCFLIEKGYNFIPQSYDSIFLR